MPHQARKRFGQNFLVDRAIIARIIDAIAPAAHDKMMEIGPGLGALTEPLLARLERLHVIEIDRDLARRLRHGPASDRLVVHNDDALTFDFSRFGAGLRVVGNLPYNISTPLLFHLARHAGALRDVSVMLQKEVVDRIVASPGTAEYGRLTVMLRYRFEAIRLFEVPPGAFRPAPQVRSAVIRLTPRRGEDLSADDEVLLGAIVTAAFGQRRKTLRNALRRYLNDADYAALDLASDIRGETLDVAAFVRIANYCVAHAVPVMPNQCRKSVSATDEHG